MGQLYLGTRSTRQVGAEGTTIGLNSLEQWDLFWVSCAAPKTDARCPVLRSVFCGSVAQSVEHWTFNPLVVGSIPTRPTIPTFRQLNFNEFQRLK